MKHIGLFFLKIIVFLFSIMPFWVIHLKSDVVSFILFHIIGYRRKIVETHLRQAFPKYSDKKIREIQKKFYRNLSDTLLETLKGFSMSEKALLKRNRVLNPEILTPHFENNQPILALTAHYTNWEWSLISLDLQTKHQSSATYMPLTNPVMEIYMRKKREKFGMKLIPVQETRDYFNATHEVPFACLFGADQSPAHTKRAIWLNFLNRDTAWNHGPETLSRKHNLPVYYYHIQRVKRGYYTVEISELIANPNEVEEGKIIEAYRNKVEAVIHEKPENYLWSHRRWKHSRTPESENQTY